MIFFLALGIIKSFIINIHTFRTRRKGVIVFSALLVSDMMRIIVHKVLQLEERLAVTVLSVKFENKLECFMSCVRAVNGITDGMYYILY